MQIMDIDSVGREFVATHKFSLRQQRPVAMKYSAPIPKDSRNILAHSFIWSRWLIRSKFRRANRQDDARKRANYLQRTRRYSFTREPPAPSIRIYGYSVKNKSGAIFGYVSSGYRISLARGNRTFFRDCPTVKSFPRCQFHWVSY